jgi:mRNA interferase RelE/StbE
MEFIFLRSFEKDVARLDIMTRKRVLKLIEQVTGASEIASLANSTRLVGHPNAYRLRIGEYRVGIFLQDGIVEFARVLHRKDIYKVFP